MLHADYGPDVAACRVRAVIAAAHELAFVGAELFQTGSLFAVVGSYLSSVFHVFYQRFEVGGSGAHQVLRAVYGDIEADAVCFALHFAHLRIVVVISKEVEGIEFFLQIVIGDVSGTFPVNERAVPA